MAIVVPLIALVLLANEYRQEIFALDLPVRVFTAIALLMTREGLTRSARRLAAWRAAARVSPDAAM